MGANSSAIDGTESGVNGESVDQQDSSPTNDASESSLPSQASSSSPRKKVSFQAKGSGSDRESLGSGDEASPTTGDGGDPQAQEDAQDVERSVRAKWEGALAFLNHDCCYTVQNKPPAQVKRSMSFAAKRAARFKNAMRRLRAACTKRGRLRRLPNTAKLAGPRNIVGEIVMSPAIQGLVLLVICLDVAVSIYRFLTDPSSEERPGQNEEGRVLQWIDWFVVSVLLLEVCARLFFLGGRFTHSLLNLMELAVVPVAIFLLVTSSDQSEDQSSVPVLLRTLRPLLRMLNLLLKAARGLSRVRQFQRQLQLQVSGNRRRWRQDGFDLDLCYIMEGAQGSLIAMGRPAVGSDAFYNNPLQEVAKFMDKRHCDRFLIINAGEKVDYPVDSFHHRVILFPVQAFGVPKLNDLWDLCNTLRAFLSRDGHCVAVHTRIGGGRVGLVIVAYLLYTQVKRQAADAMSCYEKKLTEPFSQETVSGVDCASQLRFMEYFSVCVRELRYVPDPPRKAKLVRIKLLGVEPEMASSLSVKCFAHSVGTAARSVIPSPEEGRPVKLGGFQRTGSKGQEVEEEEQKNSEEALLFIKDEDEIFLQAQKERAFQEFDSFISGCRPNLGNPLLDTSVRNDPKFKNFEGEDMLQNEVVVWQIDGDGLEVQGEICFEIHRAFDNSHEETQLLLATWLHTSFLEMSQGSQAGAGASVNNRSVCVTLQRFDMDKGANAPSLRSYGSSFEVQLLFEVDEVMQYHWDDQGLMDDVARLTGKTDYQADYRSDVLRLQPPTGEDVSDSYPARWLTWGVGKLWPSIDAALQKLIKEELEPALQALNTPMGYVHIDKFSMGTEYPELGPITASQRSGVRDGLQLDIFMRYQGNANIVLQSGTAKVGVTHIGVNGTLSLLFDPIVHSLPIVGGLHIFFLNPPQVVLTFVGLADPLNLGVLKNLISNQFNKLLADKLVLPNVLSVNWMEERLMGADPVAWLSSMLPTGVLQVAVTELEPITPAEWRCEQTGTRIWQCTTQGPNRYVTLRLGAMESKIEVFGHQVQDDNTCFLLVFDNKQNFTVEVWEREAFGQDTLLGTSQSQPPLTLLNLLNDRGSRWLPLETALGDDLGSGMRLKYTLYELHADKRQLPRSEETPKEREVDQAKTKTQDIDEASTLVAGPAAAGTLHDGAVMLASAAEAIAHQFTPSRGPTHTSTNLEDVDGPQALLIASLIKGRVPLGEYSVKDFELRVSVEDYSDVRTLMTRDTSWMQEYKEQGLSPTTANTIEELSKAGFPSDKIATMLKMEEVRVSKVVAHRLGFNVELPQHLSVLVPRSSLTQDGRVALEVLHRGATSASGEVPLSSIWRANSMRLRSLVELKEVQPVVESSKVGVDGQKLKPELDVEFRLFSFVSHRQYRASKSN